MNSPKIENCRIYRIGEKVTLEPSGFTKRELVIVINEDTQYPDHVAVEAHKDKCSLFDNLTVGDIVDVDVNIRGRVWTDKAGVEKVFNSLVAWQVSVKKYAPKPVVLSADDDTDLPF